MKSAMASQEEILPMTGNMLLIIIDYCYATLCDEFPA